jgi:hypothetical protein
MQAAGETTEAPRKPVGTAFSWPMDAREVSIWKAMESPQSSGARPSAERSGFTSAPRHWLAGRGELALAFIRQGHGALLCMRAGGVAPSDPV